MTFSSKWQFIVNNTKKQLCSEHCHQFEVHHHDPFHPYYLDNSAVNYLDISVPSNRRARDIVTA